MDNDARYEIKVQIYEQFAQMGKAFGNPKRLEIIDLLSQVPHTVEDLAAKTGLSIASVSQHLQVLKHAKLVTYKREGTHMRYRLTDENVFEAWKVLRDLAQQHILDIENLMATYFSERNTLEKISAEELLVRMRDEDVLLLDVRPADEYEAGHIPNAISIPIEELEARLETLPKDVEIIAYCRASYCLFSDRAALLLREKGYKTRVYKEGMPEWRRQGLPIENSDG